MGLCAVSVDLDEIGLYHRLHGLPEPEAGAAGAVYERALERWLAFAEAEGLPLTLFVVASDLLRDGHVDPLRAALRRGHEIGSHSRDHLYDLVRRGPGEQREQVEGALEIFQDKLGFRPLGFRAPGYLVSDELLQVVAAAGHGYDSSLLPSPAYYAAKLSAVASLRLRGRRSAAIVDRPNVLRAPTRPYRIGRPYFTPGSGLVELPIQVTRGLRLPFIGTALALAGELGARALTELVVGEPFVNLELHGIDLLDADDGLGALRREQPDLAVRVADKRRAFQAVFARLRKAGYEFVRLERGMAFAA